QVIAVQDHRAVRQVTDVNGGYVFLRPQPPDEDAPFDLSRVVIKLPKTDVVARKMMATARQVLDRFQPELMVMHLAPMVYALQKATHVVNYGDPLAESLDLGIDRQPKHLRSNLLERLTSGNGQREDLRVSKVVLNRHPLRVGDDERLFFGRSSQLDLNLASVE